MANRRTGTREIVRAKERAASSLERADRKLKAAERAKTCALRTELALDVLEHATHASCEASGYRTWRLPAAITVQNKARKIILDCAKKRG